MSEKGPARRCSMGCETFPDDVAFRHCPICGELTDRISNGIPIEQEEAERLVLHALFEEFYEKWCLERGQPFDGPLPEKPGRAVAAVSDAHDYE